jgi:hypothetical protein
MNTATTAAPPRENATTAPALLQVDGLRQF